MATQSKIGWRTYVNPTTLSTGLYAVYKAESNANDSIGTYNGTAQGGLTYTAGKSGNAFTFNGTNAAVSLPNNTFNSLTGDFSITGWVYIPSFFIGTDRIYILCDLYTPEWARNFKGFALSIGGGNIQFIIANGSSYNGNTGIHNLIYNYAFATSNWYHIVAVKESSGRKIYLNGALAASDSDTTNVVFHTTQTPQIGRMYIPGVQNEYFATNGSKVDEVNIYNRALTSTEVTTLYNSGAGKFYPY